MKLYFVIPVIVIISVAIIILIVVLTRSDKISDAIIPAKNDTIEGNDYIRFNQTKYQHNVTKSDGRANIFNVNGTCKLWGAENRIDEGMEAEIGELPCIALLEYLIDHDKYSFDCAGALINHRYVVTAAQCLDKKKNLVNVRLGEHDVTKNPDCDEENDCQPTVLNVGIELVTIHADYAPNTNHNDIGLIRLSTDVRYVDYFIQPICIPDATISTEVGVVAKVAGWGRDGVGKYSPILRRVWVKIVDLQKCRDAYSPKPIHSSQLCAGGERDRNACIEDLGGPLIMRHNRQTYIEGIVSFSSGCTRMGIPDIYTKVNYFFDWIENNLKP